MVDIYVTRNSGTSTISIHQGVGSLDETFIMEMEMVSSMADTVIGDFLAGSVTVHGVGE